MGGKRSDVLLRSEYSGLGDVDDFSRFVRVGCVSVRRVLNSAPQDVVAYLCDEKFAFAGLVDGEQFWLYSCRTETLLELQWALLSPVVFDVRESLWGALPGVKSLLEVLVDWVRVELELRV